MDLRTHLVAWKRHLEHGVGASPRTVESYVADVRQFDGVPTRDGVEDFLARLGERGIKGSSRARKLAALRNFFRWLVDRDLLVADPTAKIRPPKTEKTLPKPLAQADVLRLVDACPPTSFRRARLRAILDLSWSCGLRVSEVCSIRLGDLADGSLLVRGKGAKQRRIPVVDEALRSVEAYLAFRPEGGDLLFVTRDGGALDRHEIATSLRTLAKKVGVEGISPHRLRHSAATGMLEGGADLLSIQAMLGHASVATTQKYTKVTDERLRAAVLAAHPRNAAHRTAPRIDEERTKET